MNDKILLMMITLEEAWIGGLLRLICLCRAPARVRRQAECMVEEIQPEMASLRTSLRSPLQEKTWKKSPQYVLLISFHVVMQPLTLQF